ncbi:MAG: alcohol dehydrogenase [Deltaproteobacteria bacterium RIFCSPHIGHO2_02_FULL_50_15]|nr:MAG: alcohol dehydrogenase [Deltaproteobacteria bacterium RIFCSPHIGHO2_02_FULL_50_15]
MKAMVLDKISPIDQSPLVLKDLPLPSPAPNEVRIKVVCCAICRTDLHVIEGDLPQKTIPLTPGHQVVGIVDQLGEKCRRLILGDRVGVAWLRHTCGSCDFCKKGQENLCESSQYTGYHAPGGYAEYTTAPEDFIYKIPEGLNDIQAAPLLCAGIIGYRALKRSQPPAKATLALYGFGSSAHVVIQMAHHRGYEVYVVTRGKKHRQFAKEMGAKWVGENASELPVKVDSAILFAPAGELIPPALEKLNKGGTLSLAGIHMSDVPTLNYDNHLFYEKNIHSVTANTRQDGQELLKEAVQARVKIHTTTYALEDANKALQDLKQDQINGTGVLMI